MADVPGTSPDEFDLATESVLVRNGKTGFEVRVPAAPEPCSYVRVVYRPTGKEDRRATREVVYWNCDEWQEGDDLTCFGAIMGVIKVVVDGGDPRI